MPAIQDGWGAFLHQTTASPAPCTEGEMSCPDMQIAPKTAMDSWVIGRESVLGLMSDKAAEDKTSRNLPLEFQVAAQGSGRSTASSSSASAFRFLSCVSSQLWGAERGSARDSHFLIIKKKTHKTKPKKSCRTDFCAMCAVASFSVSSSVVRSHHPGSQEGY